MRPSTLCVLFLSLTVSVACFAQSSNTNTSDTVCTFADGQQITVRYHQPAPKQQPPSSGVWGPGGAPMYLFTQSKTVVNNTEITPGAYSLYLTGAKNTWTLVVNKDVTAGAQYDSAKDLVRAPMQSGKLPNSEDQLHIYFVHPVAKTCNLRIYYKNTGYWAEFNEK